MSTHFNPHATEPFPEFDPNHWGSIMAETSPDFDASLFNQQLSGMDMGITSEEDLFKTFTTFDDSAGPGTSVVQPTESRSFNCDATRANNQIADTDINFGTDFTSPYFISNNSDSSNHVAQPEADLGDFDFNFDWTYTDRMQHNIYNPVIDAAPEGPAPLFCPGLEIFDQLNYTAPAQYDAAFSSMDDNGGFDFSNPPEIGNFSHASPTALPAPHSPNADRSEAGSTTPKASEQTLDQGKYAHFSVPIDTDPDDLSDGESVASATIECEDGPIYLKGGLPKVINKFPVWEEIGWHPGQPLPTLDPNSFYCPPRTSARQTATSGVRAPTRTAPNGKCSRLDEEYDRMVAEFNENRASESEKVAKLNRTTKNAHKALHRQAAKQYTALTGKVYRPSKQTARKPAENRSTVEPTRRNVARKARAKAQQLVDESSDSELSELESVPSESELSEHSELDDDSDEDAYSPVADSRKRTTPQREGTRHSKRVRRAVNRS